MTSMIGARNVDSSRTRSGAFRWLTVLGLVGLDGCSLQNFDGLSNGKSASSGAGQSTATGAAGSATAIGDGGLAGVIDRAGASATGAATNSVTSGGVAGASASNATGLGNSAGSVNVAGTTAGGSSSSSSISNGGSDLSGCAAPALTGSLVVPPSTGFETNLAGWTTTAAHTSALSRVPGNGTNCEGNWYMSCSGSQRQANWDGPMLEVLSYLTIGHTYQYSVAARQSPGNASTASIPMKLTVARTCSTTVYDDIVTLPVSTNWVRLTGKFALVIPGDCSTLSSVKLFVATNESGSTMVSFDVDDLRLVDLTAATTLGGAAGASSSGTAGAAGSM